MLILVHLMGEEIKDDAERFETMIRTTILAGDREIYDQIYGVSEKRQRERVEEEVEWMTPENAEEIEAILKRLEEQEA